VLVWAAGLAVAIPATFVGFLAVLNGLGTGAQAAPPLLTTVFVALLLLPLVLSVLLFHWRLAGWLWAGWWSMLGIGLLVDALATACCHGHGVGALFSASASLWGSALLAAAVVTAMCLLQLWLAATVAQLRGWTTAPPAFPGSRRGRAFAAAACVLVLAAALVLAWGPPLPFDAPRWQACGSDDTGPHRAGWGDNTRVGMLEDLMVHYLRPDMTEAEVIGLLGEADHPDVYALFPRPTLSQTLLALFRWGGPCPGLEIAYGREDPAHPGSRRLGQASILGDYIGFTD
jgi:hypothetical protein